MECKFGWRMRILGDGSRINRYIMECKSQRRESKLRTLRELIDTLWNVNFEMG